MSNVVELRPGKPGDRTFFMCGCNPNDPIPFLPIVIVQQAPAVVGMQCPGCATHYAVVNGIVQKDPSPANGA